MEYLRVVLLAALQGLAEFLPISSSGHLVIADALLECAGWGGVPDFLELSIVLHAGTLLSVLVVYWRRFWHLLGSEARMIGPLLVGTLPAVAVGLPLHEMEWLKAALLESPLVAGLMLPVTGVLLLASARCPAGQTEYAQVTYRQALVIGLFQAVAILPGISRSGSTIAAGLFVGLRRDAAATFSFLLGSIATAGACLLELRSMLGRSTGPATPAAVLVVGLVASFVVGVLALVWLLRWLERGRLKHFAWWCIPVGVAVTVWQVALLAGR